MYVSQEKFRTIILIIAVFLIGFLAGYFSKDIINEEIMNKNIENINSFSNNENT